MNYLVDILTQPITTKPASATFKDICRCNSTRLLKYLDPLLKIHASTMELPGFSQKNILEGISRVLWSYKEDMTEYMRQICAPYVQSLQEIITASSTIESGKLENKLCEICDRITIIIKGALDEDVDSKPVALLFRNIWDTLKQLLPIFKSHPDAIEKLCRIVKHCMRKIGDDFIEYLPEFTQIIVVGFHDYMHSTYLYMAENIVRTFTSHSELQQLITYLFTEMVKTTLTKLNSFEALRDNPEVTEDFFGMMIRYLNYCPQAVIESRCLPQAVACAAMGIGIDHIEVARCMYGFLENLLDYSDRNDARYLTEIEEVVLHYYKEVLNRCIQAVIEVMPGEVFDCIVDLITRTSETVDITNWLNDAMSLIPHYTLTESEKQKLVQCARSPSRLYSWFQTLHRRAKTHKLTVKE